MLNVIQRFVEKTMETQKKLHNCSVSSEQEFINRNHDIFIQKTISPKCMNIFNIMEKYLTRFRNNKMVNTRDMNDYSAKKVFLIVVNYHHNNYSSAVFIRNVIYNLFALYYPYDFDLLLIGPRTNINQNVLGNELPTRGYYSYHSLTVAYNTFPPQCGYRYSGYFLANDDSCLQPKFLGLENHNRAMAESWFKWTNKTHWMWNWKINSHNISFSQAFFEALDEIDMNPSISKLCVYNRSQLRKGWGDFFYVPKSLISRFLKIEDVMFKHQVFLESAVPFIMNCLNATIISNCNHGKMLQRETCVHLHPVKYSRMDERSICINRITNTSLLERPNTW